MKGKTRVVVLMGGKTPEHEISLISGREVVKNLPKNKYRAIPMVIPWSGKLPEIGSLRKVADVVFIAMHGPFGEDGTVQGMLDLIGIPYTGSGVLASAVGMNKIIFKQLMKAFGIPVPKHVVMKKNMNLSNINKSLGAPPYFVKPYDQGSSVGASIAKTTKDLPKALRNVWKFSDTAIVEEYLRGRELTCGLLGNENPRSLPIVEIVPAHEFFDYKSKYSDSKTREIAPARIPKKLTTLVQKTAVKVHQILGCRGFSRVDFILKNDKTPVVLEINTIPGLTPMSLLPKAAKAAGITYPQLLDTIIQYAIK